MKFIPALSLFLLPFCASSQVFEKDTTIRCVAHWKKGEEKRIHITRIIEEFRAGDAEPPFNFDYYADITVLDSNKKGYSLQWKFRLPDEIKKINPHAAEAMPVYEGLKMIFTTDTNGSFKELINWQEVRDAYVKMTLYAVPKNLDDSNKAKMDKVLEAFNSKEMVEATLIKELLHYHEPFGNEFSIQGIKATGYLQNPWGGDPIPATSLHSITELIPSGKNFKTEINLQMDSIAAVPIAQAMLKKFGLPEDTVSGQAKAFLSTMTVTDKGEYVIERKSGWALKIKHTRTIAMAEMKKEETIILEMQ